MCNRLDGQRMACSGTVRVEVPADTTHANISEYMVVEIREPQAEPRRIIIKGSRGRSYDVRLLGSGVWTCTCPGNHYRGKCKHIEQAKKELNNG
mgnify:FL=1